MDDQKATVLEFPGERVRRDREPLLPSPSSVLLQSTGVTKQEVALEGYDATAQSLARAIQQVQEDRIDIVKINFLPNKNLRVPIEVTIQRDGEGFIARTLEIPLYGYGEDYYEAIAALKREIESLYDDLMEDDNFTDDWLKIKKFLRERITG
jgi:hypothetical protein